MLIANMSELPFSFKFRKNGTEPHFALCPMPMHLGMINIKLKVEVISRVAWEGAIIGRDTQSFKYIDTVFPRWAGMRLDSFLYFHNFSFCIT